ncbi:RNA 2'-phosphotransferase [Candidatus Methanomethylophilus sp. 1R26]|uniref:RNA 2'-phosphotransferase n=1 Tax=Candidatus Methanomethylophilus sp. 1R26 TaxID=1769296 RepID=UPI001F1C6CD5|nr:RNA 2'-phosphotransferase [Candidatus Methanomethylophilus sp. 1R26]
MISECREHGPFRGDSCPVCGAEGRLVLSDIETDRLGRLMAAVLRHGKYGLEMSPDGYVSADDIAAAARGGGRMGWLTGRHFLAIAATDPRGRYQVLGDRIRATYGHTIDVDLRLPSEASRPSYTIRCPKRRRPQSWRRGSCRPAGPGCTCPPPRKRRWRPERSAWAEGRCCCWRSTPRHAPPPASRSGRHRTRYALATGSRRNA